jgi:hypothetical protein
MGHEDRFRSRGIRRRKSNCQGAGTQEIEAMTRDWLYRPIRVHPEDFAGGDPSVQSV